MPARGAHRLLLFNLQFYYHLDKKRFSLRVINIGPENLTKYLCKHFYRRRYRCLLTGFYIRFDVEQSMFDRRAPCRLPDESTMFMDNSAFVRRDVTEPSMEYLLLLCSLELLITAPFPWSSVYYFIIFAMKPEYLFDFDTIILIFINTQEYNSNRCNYLLQAFQSNDPRN